MTTDPFDFVFDKHVRDSGNGVRLDITVADPDSDLLLTLRSGALDIPFFLKPFHARMLATYLLQACDAFDRAVAESSETGSQ